MTTKGPSQKQVIVSINNEVAKRYLKNSSIHIININHVLKNIKSDIVITTNKMAAQLDLQTIEQYVKSTNHIETEKIETLYLS